VEARSIIEGIKNDRLCLGCGLCEAVCGKESVEMKLDNDGFFRPHVKSIQKDKEQIISEICPGVNIDNDLKFSTGENIWGKIEKLYSGFATDSETRNIGSSGGIVSAIAIYLLEKKMVNGVLQVGGDSNDYERNSLRISRNKEDVLKCASSRYAPALVFDQITEILNGSNDNYAFIGKPCDISALKNFLTVFPQYKDRFVLTVSIMCAGMPSFLGTNAIVEDMKAKKPVKKLVYRGNGWPGYFSFTDSTNQEFKRTYNDSWGMTLNKYLNFRCKICPDGIGLQADIAVGDAWETKDGYPDFTEREGQSLVIVRTEQGAKILDMAKVDSAMIFTHLEKEKLALMQPYQYQRRRRVGARTLAYMIGKQRKLNFKNLALWNNMFRVHPRVSLGEFVGTFIRVVKNQKV
jgi:coenzyme F420 hydrogenase subunit beta